MTDRRLTYKTIGSFLKTNKSLNAFSLVWNALIFMAISVAVFWARQDVPIYSNCLICGGVLVFQLARCVEAAVVAMHADFQSQLALLQQEVATLKAAEQDAERKKIDGQKWARQGKSMIGLVGGKKQRFN